MNSVTAVRSHPGPKSHPELRPDDLPVEFLASFHERLGRLESPNITEFSDAAFHALEYFLPGGTTHDGKVSDPLTAFYFGAGNCRARVKTIGALASLFPNIDTAIKVTRMSKGEAHFSNIFFDLERVEMFEFDQGLQEELGEYLEPMTTLYNAHAEAILGGSVGRNEVSVVGEGSRPFDTHSVVEGGEFLARINDSSAPSINSFIAFGALGNLIINTKGLGKSLLC